MPEHETERPAPAPGDAPQPARRSTAGREAAAQRDGEPRLSRGYARARERDAAARAELRPLAPGERPPALAIAAGVAALIAIGNLALMAGGWEVDGQDPPLAGSLLFAALMLAAAVGLWQRRYLAVVAFEALLGLGITWAGLSLLVAANVAAVALCVTLMAGGGWLFWKLVRVMGRIQAARRTEEPVG